MNTPQPPNAAAWDLGEHWQGARYSGPHRLPMFEVMMTMAFLKPTVRPWPSASLP